MQDTKRAIVVSLISNSKHCQVINGWVIPLQEKFPRKRNVIISPKSEGLKPIEEGRKKIIIIMKKKKKNLGQGTKKLIPRRIYKNIKRI